jgi:two-component system phosphate regulon response regulator PhoB
MMSQVRQGRSVGAALASITGSPRVSSQATILVVDDERDLVELIRFNLERNRYVVLTAGDGEAALASARADRPDLIVLDLLLPRKSGREVAALLKADPDTRAIPLLMLTALSAEGDVVTGLQLGADDYVTKPFSMEVLMARVGAILRRRGGAAEAPPLVRAGPVRIDRGRYEIRVDDTPIHVTLTEFRLLDALVAARSRVLTRDQLISKAMGPDIAVTDRTIDVHVTSLRRKLGAHRDLVETVRGVGYRFADVWRPAVEPL